jgi:hypothetical protein
LDRSEIREIESRTKESRRHQNPEALEFFAVQRFISSLRYSPPAGKTAVQSVAGTGPADAGHAFSADICIPPIEQTS